MVDRTKMIRVCVGIALCIAIRPSPGLAAPEEVIAWVRENAVALDLAESDSDARAAPLAEMIGPARLIALGEGTHGTREFYQFKHDLIVLATQELSLDALIWETDVVPALRINDILRRADPDTARAVSLLRGYNWQTEEIHDLFKWIADHNQREGPGLRFVGIDIFAMRAALEESLSHFPPDTDGGRALRDLAAQHFAVDFGSIVREDAAFEAFLSGMTLTQMRALMEFSDLLADLLATGDVQWDTVLTARSAAQRLRHLVQFYALVPNRPGDTASESFARLRTARGTAPEYAETVRKFFERKDPDYWAVLAPHIMAFQDPRQAGRDYRSMEPKQRDEWFQALAGAQARAQIRYALPSGDASREEIARTIEALSGLEDLLDIYHDFERRTPEREILNIREKSMADNIVFVLSSIGQDSRVIYSAHNFHINRSIGPEGGQTSGSLLASRLGGNMVSVATMFGSGEFQARNSGVPPENTQGPVIQAFEVGHPPEGSWEEAFSKVGMPAFALDLRRLPEEGPVSDWFEKTRPMRWIGNAYDPSQSDRYFYKTNLSDQFDVIVYFDETARARPTDAARRQYTFHP